MWRQYFGDRSEIVGIDANERCQALIEDGIHIETGNQADRGLLRNLMAKYPRVDIVIDDGGHQMVEQITSFEGLFWHVSNEGVYLCEDLHTSYWSEFGGGWRRGGTFVEYGKALIDSLNAWHSRDLNQFPVTEFTRTAWSMHFYDSVLVIEKRPRPPPQQLAIGKESF